MIRRTASEVLRSLEARVARLEGGRRTASTRRVANKTIDVPLTPQLKIALSTSISSQRLVAPAAKEIIAVEISEDMDLSANIHQIEVIVSELAGSTYSCYLDADPEFFGAVLAPNGSIKAVDPRGLARFISTTKLDWE